MQALEPLVSVVMPAYNASSTIANSILSILHQTYKKCELIIVDDGSADTSLTQKIVERINDPRIKFIRRPHEGVVKTRMMGYNLAKGQLLAVQDADDLSMPDRLERAVAWFRKYPNHDVYVSSLYACYWNQEFDAVIKSYRQAKPQKKEDLLKAQTIPGIPIFRKKVIKKCPLRDETEHCYDWQMHLDWMYSGFTYGFDDVATYEYVRRLGSLSERNEREGKRHEGLLALQKIMKEDYGVEFTPDDWKKL